MSSSVPISAGSAPALTRAFVSGQDCVAALVDVARRSASVDQVRLPIERLKSWQAAGAGLVLLELPRPGRLGLAAQLPRAAQDAGLAAGAMLIVADGSAVLVPSLDTYGPVGDRGTTLTWTHLPAEPIPEYRYRMAQRRQVEHDLLEAVQTASHTLTGLRPSWARSAAAPAWTVALPPGLPAPLRDLVERSARLLGLAREGLAEHDLATATDLHTATQRGAALRDLEKAAVAALVDATNLAALALADSD